jgi:hypothetical protein
VDLGNPLSTHGINWFEVARRLFIGWIPILLIHFVLTASAGGESLSIPYETLLAILFFYSVAILLFAWRNTNPIRVYQNGVEVGSGKNQKSYRWRDLTHMEGTRSSFGIEGIPLAAYGANHIYAGNDKAFSIFALTAKPSLLAAYIVMRMVEQHVAEAVADYKRDQELQFGEILLNQQGLGNQKHWIDWMDVGTVRLQEGHILNDYRATIIVERVSTKRSQKFGNLSAASAYLLMGILDTVRGRDDYAQWQADYFKTGKRALQDGKRLVRIALLIAAIAGILLGVLYLPLLFKRREEQAKREALVTLLNEDATTLCFSENYRDAPLASLGDKFMVIDADHNWIYEPYQQALDPSLRATSQQELTAVICLRERRLQVEQCIYGDDPADEDGYHFSIYRFQRSFGITVLYKETREVIIADSIDGPQPRQCPDKAEFDDPDIIGTEPSPESFIEWFKSVVDNAA